MKASLLACSVVVAASLIAAGSSAAAPSTCSMSAARQIVEHDKLGDVGDPNLRDPVGQLICGAFTGGTTQDMAVTLATAGSLGVIGWAVFAPTNASWRTVFYSSSSGPVTLTAQGSDILVSSPVRRKGDPLCCATGGTSKKLYHWNGSHFVVVSSAIVGAPKAKPKPPVAAAPGPGYVLPATIEAAFQENGITYGGRHQEVLNVSCSGVGYPGPKKTDQFGVAEPTYHLFECVILTPSINYGLFKVTAYANNTYRYQYAG